MVGDNITVCIPNAKAWLGHLGIILIHEKGDPLKLLTRFQLNEVTVVLLCQSHYFLFHILHSGEVVRNVGIFSSSV